MKVWVDAIAKWVVAKPLSPLGYQMPEEELKALLERPVAPKNPGRWLERGGTWVKAEPIPSGEYRMPEEELRALLSAPSAPKNPGRWIDRVRRDAGEPL
mgnify:CR=1 FL=1